MHHFKKQDFEELLFPVHTLKKGDDVFDAFPRLLDYSEFQHRLPASLNINKVFKYIVYVYDKKSPYRTQIEDLVERKIEAAMEAGFSTHHNGGFSDSAKSIFECDNSIVNRMIIRYLRIQGKDFTGLIVDQEAYYQIKAEQLASISGEGEERVKAAKSKAELGKLANETKDRLDDSMRNFLEQETAVGLHKEAWKLADDEADNIKLTPEDYAAKVQES
jgi:hypothetical protein